MKPIRLTMPNSRRGFTLTEVLIASVINLIIMAGAVAVFVAAAKLQHEIFNHNTVDAEARKVENWLVSDLRNAITLADSYNFGGENYIADNSTLIMMLPAVDIEGIPIDLQDVVTSSAVDVIVYYHTDADEMRRLLVRHKDSWRDGRNDRVEDRAMADSANAGIKHTSAFSVAPGILGPVVVHYEFRTARQKLNDDNPYLVASAGSVYLRNRPVDPP